MTTTASTEWRSTEPSRRASGTLTCECYPPAYLDECIDLHLVDVLTDRGFSVTSAQQHGMKEADDLTQLAFASANGWVLVTHNANHFRQCHDQCQREGRLHGGIAIVPNTRLRPPSLRLLQLAIRTAMLLEWLATLPDGRGLFVKWGLIQQRLEAGHHPPNHTDAEIRLALGRSP